MFTELVKFLYEAQILRLPGIGIFELKGNSANVDHTTDFIQPRSWSVSFRATQDVLDQGQMDSLLNWLAIYKKESLEVTKNSFTVFVKDLENILALGEKIVWENLGVLTQESGAIHFSPEKQNITPFTNVAAKKVVRKNTSYASLVGDKETTTGEMRELLSAKPESNNNLFLWILLGLSIVAASWFFVQNGN